ncbi:MAG: flagellar basal body-associated FliL family protein [Deltaproteobacteria bacterium]
MKKILALLLPILGLGGGIAAGVMLQPKPEDHAATECAPVTEEVSAEVPEGVDVNVPEFVKLNNQFIVPIIKEGKTDALVVLSLSLEVQPGKTELVYQREPKLRDAFLRTLFDHANLGGFSDNFTENGTMLTLRTHLLESAQAVLGKAVKDVLVIDIVRQDGT